MALPTSVDLLDRARRALAVKAGQKEPVSDYRVAQVLGVTKAAVSQIRKGRTTWGFPTIVKVAEIIGVDPKWALAVVEVERAQRAQNAPLARLWGDVTRKLGVAFLPLILSGSLLPHPAHADDTGADARRGSVYSVKSSWWALYRRLLPLFCRLVHTTLGVQDACQEQGAF